MPLVARSRSAPEAFACKKFVCLLYVLLASILPHALTNPTHRAVGNRVPAGVHLHLTFTSASYIDI